MKYSIVYDTETTGFSPVSAAITQLAAEKTYQDSTGKIVVVDKFNRFIKVPYKVPQQITELTGITNEKLDREGLPVNAVMKEFKDFVGDDLLVAHNGKRFDSAFMRTEMAAAGIEYHCQELDTMILAKSLWPDRKRNKQKYTLGALVDDFGLVKAEAHRADNDVEMLVALLYYERQQLLQMDDKILMKAILSQAMFLN